MAEIYDWENDADFDGWQEFKWESSNHFGCPTCGAPVRIYGQRCDSCKRNLDWDKLERESGR